MLEYSFYPFLLPQIMGYGLEKNSLISKQIVVKKKLCADRSGLEFLGSVTDKH